MATRRPESAGFQSLAMLYIIETFGPDALLDVLKEREPRADGKRCSGHRGERCEWAGLYRSVCDHGEVKYLAVGELFGMCSQCDDDTVWVLYYEP